MAKKMVDALAKKILWLAALALCKTYRVNRHNSSLFENSREHEARSVIAFWHGSMLAGWYVHRPRNGASAAALASQSKDGEILSATLARWGYRMIRGSSRVGGKEAMQMMVDAIAGGCSLCITPDGPTGPRHRMKMGAVRAAQRAQVPLFLVGVAASRKKILNSWDRFEIPLPFSTLSVWYSDPIFVPGDLRDEPLDRFLEATEAQLLEVNEKAAKAISG